jgi:hypothetical protein
VRRKPGSVQAGREPYSGFGIQGIIWPGTSDRPP